MASLCSKIGPSKIGCCGCSGIFVNNICCFHSVSFMSAPYSTIVVKFTSLFCLQIQSVSCVINQHIAICFPLLEHQYIWTNAFSVTNAYTSSTVRHRPSFNAFMVISMTQLDRITLSSFHVDSSLGLSR